MWQAWILGYIEFEFEILLDDRPKKGEKGLACVCQGEDCVLRKNIGVYLVKSNFFFPFFLVSFFSFFLFCLKTCQRGEEVLVLVIGIVD